jgi:hypothetical protein
LDGPKVPVRVATSLNDERPAIEDESETRPEAEDLTLLVAVSGMRPGVGYKLYRYDSLSKVPKREFNQHASQAAMARDVSRDNPVVMETIASDEVAVYRSVEASAP